MSIQWEDSMQQICQGVFLVAGGDVSAGGDAMAYLVQADSLALIDAGASPDSGEFILDQILRCGHSVDELEYLLITHGHVDHIGGVSPIAESTGCKVVCHQGDAEAVVSGDPLLTASGWYGVDLPKVNIDEVLYGEQGEIGGLKWLATPGHTPGSVVYLYESEEGLVLFGQDIHGPFSPDFNSDKDKWAESMKKLIALEADILCEGHYGIYEGKKRVRGFIENHLRLQGY